MPEDLGPFAADQAARVVGLDSHIAAIERNRARAPVNYMLNPFVSGPIREVLARLQRRSAASTATSWPLTIAATAVPPLGVPLAMAMGGESAKQEARDMYRQSPLPTREESEADREEAAKKGEHGPYDVEHGARVDRLDKAIAAMAQNRREHIGHYLLNPFVGGPVREGLGRLSRRVNATQATSTPDAVATGAADVLAPASGMGTLLQLLTYGPAAWRGDASRKTQARQIYNEGAASYNEGSNKSGQFGDGPLMPNLLQWPGQQAPADNRPDHLLSMPGLQAPADGSPNYLLPLPRSAHNNEPRRPTYPAVAGVPGGRELLPPPSARELLPPPAERELLPAPTARELLPPPSVAGRSPLSSRPEYPSFLPGAPGRSVRSLPPLTAIARPTGLGLSDRPAQPRSSLPPRVPDVTAVQPKQFPWGGQAQTPPLPSAPLPSAPLPAPARPSSLPPALSPATPARTGGQLPNMFGSGTMLTPPHGVRAFGGTSSRMVSPSTFGPAVFGQAMRPQPNFNIQAQPSRR